MRKLTESDLDNAIFWRSSGYREIDTHEHAGKVQSDVCCNGNCSQGHGCPRYQPAHDELPMLSWASLVGVILGLCVVAYLFNVGMWQWN